MKHLKNIIPAMLTLAVSMLLTACGGPVGGTNATARPAAISGTAYGGRQPIAGSTVTVYAAGLNPGDTATQIGQAVTSAQGTFNIAAFNPTPTNGQLVYVVAQGGDAGGGTNSVSRLMTLAGPYAAAARAAVAFRTRSTSTS